MKNAKAVGNVLIVDDTVENLSLLSKMLIDQGLVVRAVRSGLEALDSINAQLPDLILLDIKLPDIDGYEVCRRLKAQVHTKMIPVIFLSILSDTEDKLNGFRVGGADYITKPFIREEVLLRVQTQLKISKLIDKQAFELTQVNAQLKSNIEDYKKTQDLLVASELKFRTVADYTYDWEYWEGENHQIKYTSPSCQRITGYTQEEFVNDPSLLDRIVHPDDKNDFITHHKNVYTLELRDIIDELKFRVVNKNGSVAFIQHVCRPIIDENNKFLGRRVSNRDITKNEIAARELNLAYHKLEALWNIANLANSEFKIMCDSILEYLVKMTGSSFGFYGFINKDETVMTIHSWSGEAMNGCAMLDKPTEFPIDSAGIWSQAVKLRKPFILNDYEKFHIAKKGLPQGHVPLTKLLVVPQFSKDKIISLAAVANRVSDYNENDIAQISAFIGGIQQITEHKKAEQELLVYKNNLEELVKVRTEKLDIANQELLKQNEKEKEYRFLLKLALEKETELSKLKTDLITTASHEFRTPLTSILSSTELLQRYSSKWDNSKKEEHIDRIKRKVEYLTKLLDDVLQIEETETGKISFKPQSVNLRNLIQECIEDATSVANESNEIIFTNLCNYDTFYIDEKLIRFIISNLLSNAIKFSFAAAKVNLHISIENSQLRIAVTDEGVGIPNAEKDFIFMTFFKASNVKSIPGTGLGLAIVKHAVDLHGGTILVDSKEGIGTTFTVTIPIRNS